MKCRYPNEKCNHRIATFEGRSPSEGQCRLSKRKHKGCCEYDFQKLLRITINPKLALQYAELIMLHREKEIPETIRKMMD